MGTVFLLGPSEWAEARPSELTPMDHRREIAKLLRDAGHAAILMEDQDDEPGEDMVAKFDRLLRRSTDVVLYWPKGAKMSTTFSEMVLLRKASETTRLPKLWFLHHEDAATIAAGTFLVKESGARSRYLTALARLGIVSMPWRTVEDLYDRAAVVAAEIG